MNEMKSSSLSLDRDRRSQQATEEHQKPEDCMEKKAAVLDADAKWKFESGGKMANQMSNGIQLWF
jgi:hypothetical protein